MPDFQEMEGWNPEGGRGKGTTYLDQFLMVLLATFTTGLVFARQSKQCFHCETIETMFPLPCKNEPCCEGCKQNC